MRKDSFVARLHAREIADSAVKSKSYRKLYADRQLIDRLDIVNELDGHSGCVNTLCWSKSGNLLASGSDDQHLNIHTYQPDNNTNQFQLTSTVATGHTQNIFSVKFMPHSSDRTLISAAGDAQVRVFDLEYSGQAGTTSVAASRASNGRRRARSSIYDGVRYLSDGDTNARVYRSHGDRVKRIVTESSPHLFLTCSEDGEVRQWDLRQPSSAYPEPRGSRYSSNSNIPPPLISYKRYGIDLNTISCSGSQPHYILLGGAHLHAFLHDRRFTGRDKLAEMGKPTSPGTATTKHEQDMLGQATQCVRKFAPQGQKRMKRADNGHITACKISDARPDEAIVSWSGDHIYSFSLLGDSVDSQEESIGSSRGNRTKASRDKKRKRKANGSSASLGQDARTSLRPRTEAEQRQDATLRIRYENGQSEDITLRPDSVRLTEQQRNAQRIANSALSIRSSMFSNDVDTVDPTARYTAALGYAATILPDMDEVIREWGYPLSPNVDDVVVQMKLREGREHTRRFVQMAGTLSRVLGGGLQTASQGLHPALALFTSVDIRTTDRETPQAQRFCQDFLKAILLWLDSGIGNLIEGFTRPADINPTGKAGLRLPIPESEQSEGAIDDYLIPYLLGLSNHEKGMLDLDANRFQTAETRMLFRTQKTAVNAFAAALRIPFQDLSSAVARDDSGEANLQAQDRTTALRFWGGKVGRSLLYHMSHMLDASSIDRYFGGLGRRNVNAAAEQVALDLMAITDEQDEEQAIRNLELINDTSILDGVNAEDLANAAGDIRHNSNLTTLDLADRHDVDMVHAPEATPLLRTAEDEELEDDEDHDNVDDDNDDEDDEDDLDGDEHDFEAPPDSSSEDDEEDGVPNLGVPRFVYRPAFQRRHLRPQVEADVSCGRPTRRYQGHCNTRTVKDVNYFGPDDNYVVSGSDDGNLFIWDRKTSELINILEGDGEVVNVVQGHPYETMLAVSGIDHSIKIFSPDARAREIARLGHGVSATDASTFSTLSWPPRVGRRRPRRQETANANGESTSEPAFAESETHADNEDYVAPNGLVSRKRMHDQYRITQQNNMARENEQEAVITIPHSQLLQLLFGQLGNAGFMPDFE